MIRYDTKRVNFIYKKMDVFEKLYLFNIFGSPAQLGACFHANPVARNSRNQSHLPDLETGRVDLVLFWM